MSDLLMIVLDMGKNYGATGGPDDFGTTLVTAGSRDVANQGNSLARGEWELGNRLLDRLEKDKLFNFWHSVRGTAYRFLYMDWNDFDVTHEELVFSGSTVQLTKRFGGFGNDYLHPIYKPKAGFVLEVKIGAGPWVVKTLTTDYTINLETGVVTWVMAAPDPDDDAVRWSGRFYKAARFNVKRMRLSFSGHELRGESYQAFYNMGPLTVLETPYP